MWLLPQCAWEYQLGVRNVVALEAFISFDTAVFLLTPQFLLSLKLNTEYCTPSTVQVCVCNLHVTCWCVLLHPDLINSGKYISTGLCRVRIYFRKFLSNSNIVPVACCLSILLLAVYGLKEAKSCEQWERHTHLGLCGIVACCCHVIIFRRDKMCHWLSDLFCKDFY